MSSNIIVYFDDAAYALQMLQPVLATSGATELADSPLATPSHWILVGCAPRVTHRVSKWVTHSARDNWRRKWADKVFAQIVPGLGAAPDRITTLLADTNLAEQTDQLLNEHGPAQVVDARKPRPAHAVQPAAGAKSSGRFGFINFAATVFGSGLLVSLD